MMQAMTFRLYVLSQVCTEHILLVMAKLCTEYDCRSQSLHHVEAMPAQPGWLHRSEEAITVTYPKEAWMEHSVRLLHCPEMVCSRSNG